MNSVTELLNVLHKSGVRLGLNGDGSLRVRGDKGQLNDSLIANIKKYKEQLIAALKAGLPFALLTEEERSQLSGEYDDAYPMSALQVGMVFHTQLEQFNGIYHDIVVQHIKCPWDRNRFEQALAHCIHEHPVLRTGFRLEGDRPLQFVRAAIELPLEVEDLRGQSAGSQERHITAWTEARKQHVFDWEKGPLFHIHIFLRTNESFEFAISFHHAVLDGWSRAALTTTLYNRYQRLLTGQALEPAKADWTYRDFVAQEQRVIANPAARAHFAEMLEDAPAEQLPRLKSWEGERRQGRFVAEGFTPLSEKLLRLACELGVPVQSVLLAAHFKALSVMSGQKRVVSCVTHNGRPEAEGAELSLGLFLNSLPQGLELGQSSWRNLIQRVAELNAASMEYRSYPLSKIQQDLNWSFSEVLFNYTHFHVYDDLVSSGEQSLEALSGTGFEQTNFDLVVDVTRGMNDAMWLTFLYNAQVLDEKMIARLGRYYVRAFEQMLSGLDRGHHEQTLLSTDEVEQLLVGWNAAQVEYRRDKCLHELFEEQVERCPQATALVYEDQSLTYDELNHQANQLAHYLRKQGVKADTLVGLCVERSLEMVVGILGILKAGGAYVPLEPGYPQERLEYMIGDSAPAVVVTQKSLQERLQSARIKLVCVDGDEAEWRSHSTENLRREETGIRPEHVAYVIYTSGSTGRPKGVMVEHRQVQRLLAVTEEDFRFGAEDVWTLFHSYAFDFSVWELWGALAYGGRLVVVPHWVARSPEEFYELLKREKVTVLNQTPTAFAQLARVDGERAERGEGLSLRAVVFGGEALKLSELKGWVERHGDEKPVLVNMYGITETTVHVTYRRIRKEDVEGQSGSVIGRPLKDLRMYLLDGNQGLVPVGTVGEMYVGGGGVARGYLKRAELTAVRFIDDPYVKGERLYRTGDLGRYLENGDLEYMGRIDAQVKVRGYRIELGEIEQQLSGLEGVLGSVVMVREDAGGGEKKLVAYVVAEGYPAEGTVSAEEEAAIKASLIGDYRKKLGEQLPEYMVPSLFVMLRELPLTGNGKVDRKALPAPEGGEEAAVYVGPRNGTEQALCEVWQEVLKQERVGVHDNFFSLGGDSILSIRVVAMLKARGIVLGVKDIFQYQTIEELAVRAATGEAGGAAAEARLEPFALLTEKERAELGEGYADAYPMSTLQAGMVFHTQLEQFNGIYHDIVNEHVKCPWDQGCFAQALADCIHEHPVLRTGFRLEGDRPLQLVHAAMELPLEVEDLRSQSAQHQERYIREWTETKKRHVFDWEKGPLFHIHIFLRAEESFEFVISFHHAVLDGWSRAAFTTTLYNRYERLLRGQELDAAKVDWTYRDFIAEEQRALESAEAKAHFAEMLQDAPAEQLPRTKSSITKHSHGELIIEPFRALSGGLIELARQLGVPVQSVLLAAHLKVLSTISGRTRAVSCVTHNGRPESEGAERSLGLFLNSVPIALEVTPGTWRQLIQRVARTSAKSVEYRGYPLAKIQQDVDIDLGEISFNYIHFHVYRDLTANSEQALEIVSSTGYEQTNYFLEIQVWRSVDENSMSLALVYNAEVWDQDFIARLGQYYVRALESILHGLDAPHHKDTLLSADEVQQLLVTWNGKEVDYPSESCLHELFEAQAEKYPDAIAVVCGGRRLTYKDLNRQANQLAHCLRELGIGTDALVGLFVERSLAMMVGILGTLKAGAAYVPLEPRYPQDRLEYMIEDSAPALLLTQSSLQQQLPVIKVPILQLLLDAEDVFSSYSTGNPKREETGVRPDHLAYVIYTSGSTGRPKGVMVEHRNLTNYVMEARRKYVAEEIVGSVVSTPLSFDATLTTLLAPLVAGKEVELLEEGEGMLEELAERIFGAGRESEEEEGNRNGSGKGKLFKVTPAHLEALEYVERKGGVGKGKHRVVIGGEQLGAERMRRWKQELLPHAVLVNEYGPTETVVGCSVWELKDQEGLNWLEGQVAAPIGKPLGNTQVYVLGESGQLQPVNSIGELYIGGAGVARGYLNQEELTKERFIPNPFLANGLGGEGGGRLYRTGDLVRWLENGELMFVGRRDEQVKLRGFRIELSEIESQLVKLPGVKAAAVLAREDSPGKKRLVAYLVTNGLPAVGTAGGEEDGAAKAELINQYRKELAAQLPEYMVPSLFVFLNELPLTANGKLDRKALLAPENVDDSADYLAPRNAIEQALCEVWQEVLNHERVGIRDNFFSLGGDSILIIRVVAMLKSRGIPLDVKDIFQYQTVEQLAVQSLKGSAAAVPTLEPFALLTEPEHEELGDEYEDAYPMSTLQAGMVFHTQLEQFSGIYHSIMADHVKCRWDQEWFEQALADCIHQHPILRTGFRLEGDRPLQLVHRNIELPLQVDDLRRQSPEEQDRHIAAWMQAHRLYVFNWEAGPLFQIHIFLRTEESFEFVISFHHALLDGWSHAAFTTMLYNRYQRLLAGQELEPASVDWTYRDFIAQEQRELVNATARAHFAEMLEDAPAEQLPRLKSWEGEPRQGRFVVEGFTPLSEGMLRVARELGVPVQSVLLAAHFKALSVMSGQKRAVSCVTHNGRPEAEGAEWSLGLFLNSLPQGLELGQSSWRNLIQRVAELNAASMEYRSYPLSKIQQDLNWSFSEVLFNYTHFHVYDDLVSSSEQSLEALSGSGFEQTNFDLVVDVTRGMNDAMWLTFLYNAQVLDEKMIARLGRYYVRALELMLSGLDSEHHEQTLLSAEEVEQLLVGWNATRVEYRRDKCLHELFEEQVERDATALAVVYGEERLSYQELNGQANQLAHYLRKQGVKSDTLVGLCVERSLEIVVGILGILKAGGAYVPLEPGYPQERLEYMIGDSSPAVLVTQKSLQERLHSTGIKLVCVDGDEAEWKSCSTDNLPHEETAIRPEHLAYVIYTSGSTGRPKGVMIPHRNVANFFSGMDAAIGCNHNDVLLAVTSISFDISVLELLWTLARGASIVLAPDSLADPVVANGSHTAATNVVPVRKKSLLELAFEHRPTLMQCTPSLMRLLADTGGFNALQTLRTLMLGGEALPLALAQEVKAALPCRLVNMYGPTETTIWSATGEFIGDVVTVGRPIANNELYILDSVNAQPVPVGVIGELYIGGDGVARGYFHQPDLTAERFIPLAFNGRPGERCYRTGDLARYLPDGQVEIVGRNDFQVKIRGHRIELGEIEHQLAVLPGISAAVVAARDDGNGQKLLVAYVTVDEETKQKTSEAELISSLRKELHFRLPDHMVPSAFVVLEALPLTPNGKIDRKALPAPDHAALLNEYVAPATSIEISLAQIWANVLGRDLTTISANANFFESGGNSLLAMQVAARVRSRFGAEVPLRVMFAAPTLAGFAQRISQAEKSLMPRISPTDRSQPVQLSYAQQRLWVLDQIDGASSQYNLPAAARLKGNLDRPALQRALDALVTRHEVLRTTFFSGDGLPVQIVNPPAVVNIAVVDLSTLSPSHQEEEISRHAQAEVSKPFNLTSDLMLRVTLIVLAEIEHVVLFTQHHIASDGWSVSVLVREFSQLYQAFSQGQQDPLPSLAIQYADYSQWQREWLQGEMLDEQLRYWRAQLAGAPAVHGLPLDKARPSMQSFAGATHWQRLDAGLLHGIHDLCRAEKVTLFMLLETAFAVLVSRYSHEGDVVIGTPIAGRLQEEVEPLIGFFVNNLALRSRFDRNKTLREVLVEQKQMILEAYAHQDVPFEMLVEELNPERDLSHDPIFQLVFRVDNNGQEMLSLPGIEVRGVKQERVLTKVDVEVAVSEGEDGLGIAWTYRTDLFSGETMRGLAHSYERLLRAMVVEAGEDVFAYRLMDQEEEARWQARGRGEERPVEKCVHELFVEQLKKTPEAVAVVCGAQRLSYEELNEKAERLAGYLVEAGVGLESRVGIYVRRSAEMLIGVLGVMKAGGAYVPLEMGLPGERVKYMVEDAGVEWVLVDGEGMERLPLAGVDVVLMDGAAEEKEWLGDVEKVNHDERAVKVTGENLAYILYTSGSTGRPKGVMVEHRNLANYVMEARRRYVGEEIVGSVVSSPLSFDATLTTLLTPLVAGKEVELLVEGDGMLEELAKRIFSGEGEGGRLFKVTPAHLEALEYVERENGVGRAKHYVVVGGEQLGAERMRRWKQELLPQAVLVNEYGPTETVVGCSVWELKDKQGLKELEGQTAAPIGRPLGNTQVHVLGESGQLQPVNSVGELHIGGAGVARGYLNQEEMTRERFIEDPYVKGGKLYRTGDLVRWLSNGELMFVGRRDEQVKVRGYRIELGEIEQQLKGLEGVRGTVVVVREDAGGEKRLVAYVVADSYPAAGTVSAEEEAAIKASLIVEYRRALSTQLPEYMVPSLFVMLQELPLTPNGKVDRSALPAPDGGDETVAYVSARNATEQALCEVWQEVLKRDQIGIHDNFFSLGGDSILSIQMVTRANRAAIAITMRQLFAHQTIAELAAQAGKTVVPEQPQGAVEGELHLLPIQREFFAADSTLYQHYNQALLLKAPGDWDQEGLQAVIAALYRRHDSLRLRFSRVDGVWRAVHEPLTAEMVASICVVESLPKDARTWGGFLHERSGHYQRSLDIERGPVVRAVYWGGKKEGRLLLVIHHLVVDGVSWRVLVQDLEEGYRQWKEGKGTEIELGKKSSSYQQWGEALKKYAQSGAVAAEREYWRKSWRQEVKSWAVDPLSQEVGTYGSSRTVGVELSEEETERLLSECPRVYRTGINELLLAGLYWGLRKWSGERVVRVRLEGHGREELFADLDTTETVGWFTTTYPLVLGATEMGNGLREVIKGVKEQYRSVPNKGIGYGLLRYELGDDEVEAGERENPVMLLFNYLGQFDESASVGGGRGERAFWIAEESSGEGFDGRRKRSHALEMNGAVGGGRLRFRLDYSPEQYGEETVKELGRSIEEGLRGVIAHCLEVKEGEYTPSDFPLAQVRQEELDEWQGRYEIERLYPATGMQKGMLFHGLLEEAAYISQLYPTLEGELELGDLRRAWEAVIERHGVLRTVFVGEGEEQQQLVMKRVELEWEEEDWRGMGEAEQEGRFEEWRKGDRERGFDMGRAPLMRVSVFRLGEKKYRMLWSHHHSLLDGWSIPLVYGEVMKVYVGMREGKRVELEEAPEYERYIEWLAGQDEEEAREYWRKYLGGVERRTVLPLDKALGWAGTGWGEEVLHERREANLSANETRKLEEMAKKQQTTVNTLVQVAWGVLLQRYSSETEVMFGAVISGRTAEVRDVERMVGLFINTVPVVVKAGGERLLEELIGEVQREFQESQHYGYLPLAEIQKQSGFSEGYGISAASMGRGLFDSLLVFENYPLDAALGEEEWATGVRIADVGNDIEDTYAVALGVTVAERLQVACNYLGHVISGRMVERLLHQLMGILRQMPVCERVGEIELMNEEERKAVLIWSGSEIGVGLGTGMGIGGGKGKGAGASIGAGQSQGEGKLAAERCVHELFLEQVKKTPEAVAVVCGGQRLTYEELNEKAERLAGYLIEAGVGLESRVGIYVRRSAEMLIGVLGVMKAGGAYVPLEMGLPAERVKYMVEDAGVEWVLVDGEGMERLPLAGVDVVLLEGAAQEKEWLADVEKVNDDKVKVKGENLAYILYTSGSTGRPKGVMVEHRNLSNYVMDARRRYVGEEIVGSVVSSPLSFDATLTTLLAPLVTGKQVELLVEGDRMLEELAERMFGGEGDKGRLFKVTPAHLEALEYVERQGGVGSIGMARHCVVVGGEQLSAERAKRWKQELLPQAILVNEYGPTETVVGCSAWELKGDEELSCLEVQVAAPIGKPFGSTQVYVLGEGGQLQPVNGVGELYIGGAGVARGYLNQPQLTAERFLPNPLGSVAGERLYRTGDLARWGEDGQLIFLGRADEQVQVRGYRIELGEIEQQLMGLDGVRAAAVMAREDAGGEKRLVAYVVAGGYPEEGTVSAEEEAAIKSSLMGEYRKKLGEQLPEYMVPSLFVLLRELPLTANGKVDRRALPAPEGGDETAVYVAPRNTAEQALCEVWQEVLKQERVGVYDNFFSLGGDSIVSIRVVAMLKARGVVLGVQDIFQYQTVEQLAAQAMHRADLAVSKLTHDADEQRERFSVEGKNIEEGVFS